MTKTTMYRLISVLTLFAAPACFAQEGAEPFAQESEHMLERQTWHKVSGTAIHYFDEDVPGRNVITHKVTPTETGVILRNTESVDIFGDLHGRALYHPETVIDEAAGTLVNTGKQVFSGTVLGEGPVLLLDEFFRVEVNLVTGETSGMMLLIDPLDASRVQCVIRIFGTGMTPEGNGMADYSGRCRLNGHSGRLRR